jgi:hypothetical protein
MSDRIRSYVVGEPKRDSMRDALPWLCGKSRRALFLVTYSCAHGQPAWPLRARPPDDLLSRDRELVW